jgi:hypothetical protein
VFSVLENRDHCRVEPAAGDFDVKVAQIETWLLTSGNGKDRHSKFGARPPWRIRPVSMRRPGRAPPLATSSTTNRSRVRKERPAGSIEPWGFPFPLYVASRGQPLLLVNPDVWLRGVSLCCLLIPTLGPLRGLNPGSFFSIVGGFAISCLALSFRSAPFTARSLNGVPEGRASRDGLPG